MKMKESDSYGHFRKQDTFKYSTNRLRKAIKCSAFRMFPGIASLSISSGRACLNVVSLFELTHTLQLTLPGLAMIPSVSASYASCSPSTSLAYSSCSLDASILLILKSKD